MRACDGFFEWLGEHMGVSYGDIEVAEGRLVGLPQHSDVLPNEAALRTRLAGEIEMPAPLASAAMDTVTEARMAIRLAQLGGIGIIHRNMSVSQQAAAVAEVKHSQSGGIIASPIVAHPYETLEQVIKRHHEYGSKFHTFPVVEDDGTFVGLLTARDFNFCSDPLRLVQDEMLTYGNVDRYRPPLTTAAVGISVDEAYVIMQRKRLGTLPLVDTRRRLAGLAIHRDIQRAREKSGIEAIDAQGRLLVGGAIGVGRRSIRRAEALVKKKVDVLVIDTAHGDTFGKTARGDFHGVIETLEELAMRFPHVSRIAGNISEPDAAERLIQAGASALKVGQSLGGTCSTGMMSGIAPAQARAIHRCARVADEYGIPVGADGGIKCPADIVVALICGARWVMIGTLFAGTDESPGKKFWKLNRATGVEEPYKYHRGMGSAAAMAAGSADRYGQQGVEGVARVAEGVEGDVPYRGALADTVSECVGGLRSAMGYSGVRTIEELREKGKLQLRSARSMEEIRPHGLIVTRGVTAVE
jgi:IMP dehydrogenase